MPKVYSIIPFLFRVLTCTVGDALVRYVNSGVTLGAVNLPEVNLRSLTLDESNHARVGAVNANFLDFSDIFRLFTSITMFLVS